MRIERREIQKFLEVGNQRGLQKVFEFVGGIVDVIGRGAELVYEVALPKAVRSNDGLDALFAGFAQQESFSEGPASLSEANRPCKRRCQLFQRITQRDRDLFHGHTRLPSRIEAPFLLALAKSIDGAEEVFFEFSSSEAAASSQLLQ